MKKILKIVSVVLFIFVLLVTAVSSAISAALLVWDVQTQRPRDNLVKWETRNGVREIQSIIKTGDLIVPCSCECHKK